jgi:hypothetical protein
VEEEMKTISWLFSFLVVIIMALHARIFFSMHRQQHYFITGRKGDENQSRKCLIIVIGTIRGGPLAWKSAIKNLVDTNHADLALFVGVKHLVSSVKNTSLLFQQSKYIWTHEEYDDWADAIDLIHGSKWRNTVLPFYSQNGGIFSGVAGIQGSGAIIFMIRWFLAQRLEKEGIMEQYERFIITRSDYYYLCPCNIQHLDVENFLWIPSLEDYGGYTDRFLVVGRYHLLSALNILPSILQYNTSMIKEVVSRHVDLWNPESLIKYRWDQDGLRVRYLPLVMFTCAAMMDKSRWKQRSQTLYPEGIYLKYRKEYFIAKETCANSSELSQWKFCSTCLAENGLEVSCADIAAQIYETTAPYLGTNETTLLSAISFTQWIYPLACSPFEESRRAIHHLLSTVHFCPACTLKTGVSCFDAFMNLTSGERRSAEEGMAVFYKGSESRRKCFP